MTEDTTSLIERPPVESSAPIHRVPAPRLMPSGVLFAVETSRCHPRFIERCVGEIPLNQFKQLFDALKSSRRWPILLVGPAGTGKTCAALCAMDCCEPQRRYCTFDEAMTEIIDAQQGRHYRGGYSVTESGWWESWRECNIVCMDEIAARERVTDFQYSLLKRALDTREGRPAIFASNLSIGTIARVFDDRIASRLAGGTVIKFDGEDRRITNA